MSGMDANLTLAVVGGTGALGSALASRAARHGIPVIIGSRSAERAETFARELGEKIGVTNIAGASNRQAAAQGTIVAVTVPFASQLDTLAEIREGVAGKIVIDATVPLVPPKVARVQLPPEGSAAVRAHAFLGDGAEVISALHNIAAVELGGARDPHCDVLVFGDRKDSREKVVELLSRIGLRSWHGGSLANSAAAEAMTSVLIFMNKTYGGHAGVKITFGADQ